MTRAPKPPAKAGASPSDLAVGRLSNAAGEVVAALRQTKQRDNRDVHAIAMRLLTEIRAAVLSAPYSRRDTDYAEVNAMTFEELPDRVASVVSDLDRYDYDRVRWVVTLSPEERATMLKHWNVALRRARRVDDTRRVLQAERLELVRRENALADVYSALRPKLTSDDVRLNALLERLRQRVTEQERVVMVAENRAQEAAAGCDVRTEDGNGSL